MRTSRKLPGICDDSYFDHGVNDEGFRNRLSVVENKDFPVVDDARGELMKEKIEQARLEGDSVGGVIECVIYGYPEGIGGPIFDGIEAKLAQILYAIPAVKGVEFGNGFEGSDLKGSENNDAFAFDEDGNLTLKTNHSGGIQGGISLGNAAPIVFDCALKPTPSISKTQETVDLEAHKNTTINIEGQTRPLCRTPCGSGRRGCRSHRTLRSFTCIYVTEEKAMSGRPDLNELRGKLDEIDNSILDLLEERMATCREIGNVKRENGMDVYVPAREEEKFKALEEIAGFESRPYVRDLFKTLMDISKVHQNKPAFGVLGRTLAHTYSPEIHSLFDSSYSYSVIEREPEELETLFKSGVFQGFQRHDPIQEKRMRHVR
ncbi:chorismate synthase [Butyrivibrio sp. AE2032]|uniref:chorismate synthase n=1 Tax=Butyrivibrio sp. AE2032 TaxID=1458463 RepID=UPI002E8DE548|nr:chorismate synthase [Butyrivibrio sp. AE2032]